MRNRMTSRFLAKVLYTAQNDKGDFQRKVEHLVFEALTYTDCEASIYKYMESVTRAEFTIVKIDRFAIDGHVLTALRDADQDPFFLVKTERISLDDVLIKEKLLIQSVSIDEARKVAEEVASNNGVYHTLIKSIVETKITDYIYAEADEN